MDENLIMITVATVVSGVVGYLAIDFLIKFLKKNTNLIFVIYRIALGIFIIVLLQMGILSNLDPEDEGVVENRTTIENVVE